MKLKTIPNFTARSLTASSPLLISLACGGFVSAAELVRWDLPVSALSPATGSTQGTPTVGTGVSSATGVTLTGCVAGTASSLGWRWYDGVGPATDLATALTQGNYFAYNIVASNVYNLSINGLGTTTFQRGGTAPNTLALLYSATDTWTPGNYRVVSTGVALPTGATDLSTALAGDLGTTPITLNSGSTGYFRMAYWGATTTSSGAIWLGNTVSGNDFSLLGTATATSVIHNLLWTGAGGNDWNTTPANTNWADIDLANAPAPFSNNDNVTINLAATIAVAAGGETPSTVTVSNPSGTVTLAGGTIAGSSLSKSDAGTLILSSANSFAGGSALTGGITEVGNSNSLGTQLVTLAGATLRANASAASIPNGITLGAGGGTIDNGSAFSVGTISNSTLNNPLTKSGAGLFSMTGGLGSTTSGPVNLTISAGSMTVGGSADVNLGTVVTLNGDLNLNGPVLAPHNSVISGTGKIVFKNASSSINPRFAGGPVRINTPILLEANGQANSANGNNQLDLFGDISGAFNFTKLGNGIVTFRTDMSYTGTTTIAGNGSLRLNGTGNLGQGDVSISAALGSLSFEMSNEITVSNNISGVGGITSLATSLAPVNLTGTNSFTGPTTINAKLLRFDGDNTAVTGGVHVLATASPATTGAIGGNGNIGSTVNIDANAGIGARLRNWAGGTAGVDYDDLQVAVLNIAGGLVVKIDAMGLVNFTESAKSFTILNADSITGFDANTVSFVVTNFPGAGTWSMVQSGNSLVLSYAAGAANPYLSWATGAPYNLTGTAALPNSDPDADGIANSVEFVIGGNPASVSDVSLLPTSQVIGSNLVFTYRISDLSAYLNPTVEYSVNLTGWTVAQNGVNGVTIGAPTPVSAGIKQIVVTIPTSLGAGGKLFTRLNVVVP